MCLHLFQYPIYFRGNLFVALRGVSTFCSVSETNKRYSFVYGQTYLVLHLPHIMSLRQRYNFIVARKSTINYKYASYHCKKLCPHFSVDRKKTVISFALGRCMQIVSNRRPCKKRANFSALNVSISVWEVMVKIMTYRFVSVYFSVTLMQS